MPNPEKGVFYVFVLFYILLVEFGSSSRFNVRREYPRPAPCIVPPFLARYPLVLKKGERPT